VGDDPRLGRPRVVRRDRQQAGGSRLGGVLRELQRVAPNVFSDFTISKLPDGTEVASSPLVAEG
jgi:hypothetical protein